MGERKIFVVYGSTGEYSERSEWSVVAYESEADARAHAEAAKRWYQENDILKRMKDILKHVNDWKWVNLNPNPFDPNMLVTYTGTDWTVEGVVLRDRFEIASPTAPNTKEDGK